MKYVETINEHNEWDHASKLPDEAIYKSYQAKL